MRQCGLQALLAYSDKRFAMGQGVEVGHYVRYYAGFRFPPSEIHEGPAVLPYTRTEAIVLIPRDGKPALLMRQASEELVRSQTWIHDVRSGHQRFGDESLAGLARMTWDLLQERGISKGKVGIAGVGATWELYCALTETMPRLHFVECTEEFDQLRMIKTDNELRIMRKAAQIADAGVEAFFETAKEGVSEYEVHQAVEKAMFDEGGDNPWSQIVSGPRSYLYFVSPDYTQRKLESGDMVLADIGSEFAGYHSDVQPVVIVGTPREGQLSLLRTNMKSIRAMIAATRPGVTDKDIVQAAVTASRGERFGDREYVFGHGYGVGYEPPFFNPGALLKRKNEETILKQNMVLCYEPGLFVPGIGGSFIEDEVIVTPGGCEVITGCLAHAERLLSELKSKG